MAETPSTRGAAVLVDVLPNSRFDEAALTKYLAARIPDFRGTCTVRQFQGGFSNPTYHLQTSDRAFVLRKKPPGQLLPSAHAVDREYPVLDWELSTIGHPLSYLAYCCTAYHTSVASGWGFRAWAIASGQNTSSQQPRLP